MPVKDFYFMQNVEIKNQAKRHSLCTFVGWFMPSFFVLASRIFGLKQQQQL